MFGPFKRKLSPAEQRAAEIDRRLAATPAPATPCPTVQGYGRHAAAMAKRYRPAQILDDASIRRAWQTDANIYPRVKQCQGDWLTGYYAEIAK